MLQFDHRDNAIGSGTSAEIGRVAGTVGISDTGGLRLPAGPTADRPTGGELVPGVLRWNTDLSLLEYYDGTSWRSVATGGGYVEDLRGSGTGNPIVDGVDLAGAAPADLHYLRIRNSDGGGATVHAASALLGPANLDIRAAGGGSVSLGNDAAGEVMRVQATAPGAVLTVQPVASGVRVGTTVQDLLLEPVGNVDVSGRRIVNLADPVDPQDAATKAYVDAITTGLAWKEPVRAATASASDLSGFTYQPGNEGPPNALVWTGIGPATFDGVSLADGDRVLIAHAADQRGNGIFVFDQGNGFRRAPDADNSIGGELRGGVSVVVNEGATWADSAWTVASPDGPAVPGTDNIVLVKFSDLGITAGAGLSRTGNTIDVNTSGVTTAIDGSDNVIVASSGTAGQVLLSTGTPGAEAQWGALDLSNPAAVTGVLPVDRGGTGVASWTPGDLIYASAPTTLSPLAIGPASTAGQATVLKVDATGTVPEWGSLTLNELSDVDTSGAVDGTPLVYDAGSSTWLAGPLDLANANAVTGILSVGNGGTGLGSVPAGAVLYGTGTSPLGVATNPGATTASLAYVLTSGNGTTPAFAAISLDQLADVNAGGATVGDVLTFDGTSWIASAASASDRLVAASASDTTPGTLDDKIVAGFGLVTQILGGGGNEQMQLSAAFDGTTVVVDGTGALAVGGGQPEQVPVSQGGGLPAQWEWLGALRNTSGDVGVLTDSPSGSVNYLRVTGTGPGGQDVTLRASGGDADVWLSLSPSGAGRVRLSGVAWPSGGVAPFSILATQNVASDLKVVTATPGGGDLVLVYDDTAGTISWVPLAAAGTSFATWQFTGNATGSPQIQADSGADTVTIEGGAGINVDADAAADRIRFELTLAGLNDTFAVDTADRVPFFDAGSGDVPRSRSLGNLIEDLQLVRTAGLFPGILVKTGTNTYAARTMVASAAADRLGIEVKYGDGVAAAPEIGLAIENLPQAASLAAADRFPVWIGTSDANRYVTFADLATAVGNQLGIDPTAIYDGADAATSTSVVDTDSVAGAVEIRTAQGGAGVRTVVVRRSAGSARLQIDTGTNASNDELRLMAGDAVGYGSAAANPVDLRLEAGANGAVTVGNGSDPPVIRAQGTDDLTVRAGDGGADLLLEATDNPSGKGGSIFLLPGDGQPGGDVVVRFGVSSGPQAWDGYFRIEDETGDRMWQVGRSGGVGWFTPGQKGRAYRVLMWATTTGATTADTVMRGSPDGQTIFASSATLAVARVVARDTVSDAASGMIVKCVVTRNGGNPPVIVATQKEYLYRAWPGIDVDPIIDASNLLRFRCTGAAGRTLAWVVALDLVMHVA